MAVKVLGLETIHADGPRPIIGVTPFGSEEVTRSAPARRTPMSTFKKIRSSARRALSIVKRSSDNRGAPLGCEDDAGEMPRNSPATSPVHATSPRSSFTINDRASQQLSPKAISVLSSCLSGELGVASVVQFVPTSEQGQQGPSTPPSQQQQQQQQQLQIQKQQQSHLQQPATPAPPTRPRSLLSALLKRASSSNLVERERSPISPTPPLKPQGVSGNAVYDLQSGLDLAVPLTPGFVVTSQPGSPVGEPRTESRALHQKTTADQPLCLIPIVPPVHRLHIAPAAASPLDVCFSAPCVEAVFPVQHVPGHTAAGSVGAFTGAAAAFSKSTVVSASASPKVSCQPLPLSHPTTTCKSLVSSVDTPFKVPLVMQHSASADEVRRAGLGCSGIGAGGPGMSPRTAAVCGPTLSVPVGLRSDSMSADGRGGSMLLVTTSSTPVAMMRSVWGLEDYMLQRRLYKGKMSSVYKGRCLRSGLPIALKVYFKGRVPANVVHMVMREVSIHMKATDHKNVLKLFGVFQTVELLVLVMELAARGSLSESSRDLRTGNRLSEAQVRGVVLEPLLEALNHLHGKGICHRDIKPENILFASDWGFRLADFGVSINLQEERAVTRAGTADYMAPEVERCPLKEHPGDNKHNTALAYTTAADIWSVGVLVYELLVGFPPVLAQSTAVTGSTACNARTLTFPASVSQGARDFITAALAPQPEDRPTVRQLRCHPWMLGSGDA